jgi:hypothetical protein
MDLDGLKIKPSEGNLAVRFLDEEGEDGKKVPQTPYSSPTPEEPDRKLCIAIVLAVGKKVEQKAGQMVAVDHWARNSPVIGDDVHLISAWEVKATLTVPA